MSRASFESFGDLAASGLSDTEKAGRHGIQAKDEKNIVADVVAKLEASGRHALAERIASIGTDWRVTVVYQDERLTTVLAYDLLSAGNVHGKKSKKQVDAVSASVILQSYLDSHR